ALASGGSALRNRSIPSALMALAAVEVGSAASTGAADSKEATTQDFIISKASSVASDHPESVRQKQSQSGRGLQLGPRSDMTKRLPYFVRRVIVMGNLRLCRTTREVRQFREGFESLGRTASRFPSP